MWRTLLLSFVSMIVCAGTFAQTQPRWIMQPALSPDGKWIAFSYKGNLFRVSSAGGPAIPLTINSSYNGYPVWSHDGRKIAFASDRYGDFDVFVMPSTGGEPTRLTFNSARDIPYDFTPDDQAVVFGTDRHDAYSSVRFPGDSYWSKLFQVPVKGGASTMINSAGTEFVHFNAKGDKFIYQDRKGYEDPWRKHHTSAVTRDIWVYDLHADQYTKVSDFKGEDREPVWGNGDVFYYLSERNGNQNLFRAALSNPAQVEQLTHFDKNPVRQLSRSNTGLLAFTYNGDLYTLTEGRQPEKLAITLDADFDGAQTTILPVKGEASEMAVSADGKQVAFVFRGDIFVSSADGSTTRRITNTPFQERMVQFSPDGRSLLYSVEHDASWDIEQVSIASKNEPYFFASTLLTTTPLLATGKDEFQGIYSPDGKKIAYLEERNILRSYDLATKTSTTLIPEGVNYSYSDGDQFFSWSPDSKYILAQSGEGGGWNTHDIVLIKDDGSGKRINLTYSGFNDEHPLWGLEGRMMYWISNKNGLKNLSRGGQNDVYAMFFDQKAWDRFQLSKEDFDLKVEMEKKDTSGKKTTGPLELNLRNLDDRTQRLTSNSTLLAGSLLSKDGEKLYYLASYEKGYDLWVTTLRTHETKQLAKLDANGGRLAITKDGKYLFVLAGGNIYKVATEDGKMTPVKINAEMELNPSAERAYIFDHAWKQVKKKLFDPHLQGVDWDDYHSNYRQFLPHINNYYDFQVLLSEFLGELNVSHTGGRYRPDFPNGDETAHLGLFYDLGRKGDGLLVKEVIAGGPFDIDGTHMAPGVIIDRINGTPVTADADYAALLNHKAGQLTMIGFHDPKTNTAYEESIKPIRPSVETSTLLYNRWTRTMEHLVDSLSGGKIGYIHVRAMDDPSFRTTFEKVLGRNIDKQALIVDTRYNGGGWLHDDLVTFLGGKLYFTLHPQGHTTKGGESLNKWTKPSCVVMSEGNYSDAFMFPYAYKELGIGKLIGMPVAGTGTAVWWETQINPHIVFGIPMVSSYGAGEDHPTENHELEPDIRVGDDYNKLLHGEDQQIEAAVKEMLSHAKQ